MREIKFRGKQTDNGEWVYGKYLQATDHWSNSRGKHKDWIVTGMIQNGGWVALLGRYAVIPETVGQYTGLKDKNGVEIYEGDVVSAEHDFYETYSRGNIESNNLEVWEEVVDRIDLLVDVVYIDGAFMCAEWYLGNFKENEIEVIGNIHDDPELMEVEQ